MWTNVFRRENLVEASSARWSGGRQFSFMVERRGDVNEVLAACKNPIHT